MNDLKVFDFENQNVRTVVVEDEPYFVGNDVAKVLGYKNGSRDVNRHVDVEDRITQNLPQYQNGTLVSKTTLINESGLYSLIFSSKLESAKRFKRWVTSEVLPQIRKQGMYMTAGVANEIVENPQILQMIAEQVAHINKSNTETNDKLKEIDNKLEGEYVTPQDLQAIQYAVRYKAENILDQQGLQLTLDTILDMPNMDVYEQAKAHKKHKEEYRYALGKLKRSILISLKKALGMKGNAPNNHIKRKYVDKAIQYIKEIKAKEVS
jgi:prophage antirepressor-like protein